MNFLFRNINNLMFGNKASESLVEIPTGQFYKIDPYDAKSVKEVVFRDASATIRRTTTAFQYQLVITRVYAEGEDQGDDDDVLDDEYTFLLDPALRFQRVKSRAGPFSLEWADPQDVTGARGWEFEIDPSVAELTQSLFEDTAYTCMYERKVGKSHASSTDEELSAFVEQVKASATANPIGQKKDLLQTPVKRVTKAAASSARSGTQSPGTPTPSTPTPASGGSRASASPEGAGAAASRALSAIPKGEVLSSVRVQLYIYDMRVNQFLTVNDQVIAEISELKEWEFQLVVKDNNHVHLCQPIEEEMRPTFNAEHKSFIFNYLDETSRMPIYTWSIRFLDDEGEAEFKNLITECIYETKNRELFRRMKKNDQEYLMRMYDDDPMDIDEREEEAMAEEEEVWEEGELEEIQEDDSDDEKEYKDSTKGSKNSQLAVGYKHDRSFVVRGDKIGVFKHTDDDRLKFATTINNVRSLDGNTFSPRKVMLHQQDSALIMMKPGEEHKLFKMDLEAGKVVEEWTVDENRKLEEIVPDEKYSQLTTNQTMVGIGHNSIFRIDPRLRGNKLVDTESKQYATKSNFSCATTTGKGELAVGSAKGEIRLYNKLGLNAKTHLPGGGDPIIGIDTTENGKWIIATCRTHLFLVNTEIKGQGGTLGFQKSMGQEKPQMKRLQLKPEHVGWLGGTVNFTPARFSTGDSEEQAIITSSGNNVIRWNFRRVKGGHYYDYTIKQYADTVVADNFKYGEDRAMIVALPSEVEMITKNKLSTP
ncbi:hypothetical protein PhCBS80983_g05678 [Powellomyces hirtus]|uniref:Vacuolar import/degradation Vid27 C-terminal domain-containing protein n=1 Tax=Powellomyces hirtus TaxID=109895 RepID=A0A507DTY3_9FUNG|nr:hypothetical protein PhCBS80983_g05678 [Powellomyces hirtus]